MLEQTPNKHRLAMVSTQQYNHNTSPGTCSSGELTTQEPVYTATPAPATGNTLLLEGIYNLYTVIYYMLYLGDMERFLVSLVQAQNSCQYPWQLFLQFVSSHQMSHVT